ncbi:BTB/POZ domain-containing protein At1g04390 isoform X1 [Amborella trichopoda]|uniref:BTB/POZ domain-containing protein At1g04390 isoform X1 n=3 Tax=Amborella trichopoda TaxID=13333 RepID=UPI0009BD9B24|nr:BTB/POZ domain-containing protein At1g04390 isoform X1 [Amborella trichopoda]XP_020523919.1 BTB/POZ domain-containing protein At1g04390 isoform X1 [Amborella trichopoda]|eukprot:XP_020523918.1 BTB/POZ domain-containing protein At1g04390 isoform X1 [Amborella trichopoda]
MSPNFFLAVFKVTNVFQISKSSHISRMHSSKIAAKKKRRESDDQKFDRNVHQRLTSVLELGMKQDVQRRKKWHSADAVLQVLAIRTISAFISSCKNLQDPLVQSSICDIVNAMEGILQSEHVTVLIPAADVSRMLTHFLGDSLCKYGASILIAPLSNLLTYPRSEIAIVCGISLNCILKKLKSVSVSDQEEILGALRKSNAFDNIVAILEDDVTCEDKLLEYYTEITILLSTILYWFPNARYATWSNVNVISSLGALCKVPRISLTMAVLHSYSALALCGDVALKLLENGTTIVLTTLHFMGSSQPDSTRIEAFRLYQNLTRSEGGIIVTKINTKPIVKSVIQAMSEWHGQVEYTGKITTQKATLALEACRSALILRWPGEHHEYFWDLGIDKVLLRLINFLKDEKSKFSRNDGDSERLVFLIWELLGWLATHCEEDFDPRSSKNGIGGHLSDLIKLTCLEALESVRRQCSHVEPLNRAVLLMVSSPCNFIVGCASGILLEFMEKHSFEWLRHRLNRLNTLATQSSIPIPYIHELIVNLTSLALYSSFERSKSFILQYEGPRVLSYFIRMHLSSGRQVSRSSISPHLLNGFSGSLCCWGNVEEWEGKDLILFLSLWALSHLLPRSDFVKNFKEVTEQHQSNGTNFEISEAHSVVGRLQVITSDESFSPGVRWYAACCMSCFGLYGFRSELGRRLGKALKENEFTDVQLVFSNGDNIRVHGIVLAARCPFLLTPIDSHPKEEASKEEHGIEQLCGKFNKEVHFSANVDSYAIEKLVEFVYTGFLEMHPDDMKKVKRLARKCNMQDLKIIISGIPPKWCSPIPACDLSSALTDRDFSDATLVATGMTESCSSSYSGPCSHSMLPVHVHRIILWCSSDYLCALFRSGMRDSCSQIINVPICSKSLDKLVSWFYSGVIPVPRAGCSWDNMNPELQFSELHVFVELFELAEMWFLEDLKEKSLCVLRSHMKGNWRLCVNIIKIAAERSQWPIVGLAVDYIAPMYPSLRDQGELEVLSDKLQNTIGAAHAQLSLELRLGHGIITWPHGSRQLIDSWR